MKVIVPKGQSFRSKLIALGACEEALAWAGRKSLRCAWRTCDRGDWMLWLVEIVAASYYSHWMASREFYDHVSVNVAREMQILLAAKKQTRRNCADFLRRYITAEQINRALNRKEYNESV
jgi:hypothetical protein